MINIGTAVIDGGQRSDERMLEKQLIDFHSTIESFCLDHPRVSSKDKQFNISLIGKHGVHPTNTTSKSIIWH